MSRMLACLASDPLTLEAAVGPVANDFASLAGLHSDGWGTAWRKHRGAGLERRVGLDDVRARVDGHGVEPAVARLLYLRFASAGSAVERANIQPFVAGGIAFQHNGALNPPARLRALLAPDCLARLGGTTDSELYFACIRERLPQLGLMEATRQTVSELRALYPAACLNALLLADDGLIVVQSAGSAPPPLAAFAARGFAREALPPEHDDRYNRLAWRRSRSASRAPGAGAADTSVLVVTSSGVGTDDWHHFDDETVTLLTLEGQASSAKSTVGAGAASRPSKGTGRQTIL